MFYDLYDGQLTIWAPIFANVTYLQYTKVFWIDQIFWMIEISQLVISILFLWIFLIELCTHGIVHYNFLVILTTIYVMYYISMAARVVIFLIQFGYIEETGPSFPLFVQIAGFIRIHFLMFAVFAVFIVIVERCFSTYYLRDYEQTKRGWISFILLSNSLILATIFAYLSIYISPSNVTMTFFPVFFTLIALVGLSVSLYAFLHRYNYRFLRELNRTWRYDQYTLSTRFQIVENMRTLKLIGSFFLSCCIFVFVCAVIYFCSGLVQEFSKASSQTACIFLEMSCALFINAITWYILRAFPKIRESLKERLMRMFHLSRGNSIEDKRIAKWRMSADQETRTYFTQLETSWGLAINEKNPSTQKSRESKI
ncbi:unnamed protein product, partial [Mesorhabditis belari]|uniref:Uncharacterized protein n=1 Tax=Mesorhabditis belari TaxID=2138241 RepID=A0AAF3F4U5_9BILA